MDITLDWTKFKDRIISQSVDAYYTEFEQLYLLCAVKNGFQVICTIQKDDGENQIDFELNHQSSMTEF